MSESRTAAWSRYWQSGAAHSCATSYDGTYDGPIAAGWRHVFRQLPPEACVVDVATGNGPLLRLLLDEFSGHSLRAVGVDAAQTSADWLHAMSLPKGWQVDIWSGMQAERLELASGSADLVMSQFGLEYTDLNRSLAECLRVLKPTGHFRAVMHHSQSRIVTLARDEAEHLDWLLDRDGVDWFARVEAMITPMSRLSDPMSAARLRDDAAMGAVRQAYDAAKANVEIRAAAALCPDPLEEAMDIAVSCFRIAARHSQSEALRYLSQVRAALGDARIRLNDLLSHAPDDAAVQKLVNALALQHREATVSNILDRGHLMAIAVSA